MTTDQPTLAVMEPCPWCQSTDLRRPMQDVWQKWLVGCASCGAEGPQADDPDAAITAWSTRTNSEPRPAGDLREALERARYKLGHVTIPAMDGDNLAVTLCSRFDDGEGEEDDNGWTEAATAGCDATLTAIHQVYVAALATRSPAPMAVHPSLELCIQFSEDGRHIRKWSRVPFDGGECLYSHPTSLEGGEGVEAGPTWRIAGQDSHFGPFVVVDGVPHDQVVVCYWRNQIQPIHLRLPGQAYVADLLRLMDEQQCREVAIIPVRHKERVSITRSQLAAHPSTQEG